MINGRWINYDFFDSYHFEFSSKMDDLRWTIMTLTRDDVYPDLVSYFYANATRGLHSDTIKSYVKGVTITLDKAVIQNILGMGSEGEINRQSIKKEVQLKNCLW